MTELMAQGPLDRRVGHQQPKLTDEFGCEFFGNAQTATGHLWTYTDCDGVVRPLVPSEALLMPNVI